MGIRYYAYAFDPDQFHTVLADPRGFLPADPLADAWGMEPGARVGSPTFIQTTPEPHMLYLDKAWWHLQVLTAPGYGEETARPAFQMFEGRVTERESGWDPWVRVLAPQSLPAIATDLTDVAATPDDVLAPIADYWAWRHGATPQPDAPPEVDYARHFLRRACAFADGLASTGRGMVYMIG